LDRGILRKVIQIGLPAGLQGAVFSVSNMCIQSAINSFGSDAVAGASIATYFDMFTYYFSGGMAQACLTFASQNHAVGKEERCTAVFRDSILLGLALTFSVGIVFYLGRSAFLGFYTRDAAVLAFAVTKMRHTMVTQFLEVPFDMPGSMLRAYDPPAGTGSHHGAGNLRVPPGVGISCLSP
jgi:Na+-driven multidrug efflux pump